MKELDKSSFGKFLAQLRRERGWTQKDLAEELYVSDKAVSKWERGLSLPDVSLLLPLAEKLGVTVTELLEGCRMPQEQCFTAAEVDELIHKALTFQTEPPERTQERVKKYLPVYAVCSILGVAEAVAVWVLGLVNAEVGLSILIVGAVLGVVYGAYAMFWMEETLPRYYDENRISQFAHGAFHMHIPGVYYNNRNWPHILKVFRVWSMVSLLLTPPACALAEWARPSAGSGPYAAVLAVYIGSLFGTVVWAAKRYEKAE